MQSHSDDATHDEALSSRIAAVNLLDLTLGHLGVDVGTSAEAVEAVIKACGESTSASLHGVFKPLIGSSVSPHSAGYGVPCSGG